jgi:ribosome-binding protein aMBF1 (putative translation factor)
LTAAPRKPKASARKRPRTWRSAARASPSVGIGLARLGKRVRRLRLEKEFSQEDLAERASLDAKHVQAIEAGQANITFASLVGIAKALGVKLAELFKGV